MSHKQQEKYMGVLNLQYHLIMLSCLNQLTPLRQIIILGRPVSKIGITLTYKEVAKASCRGIRRLNQ